LAIRADLPREKINGKPYPKIQVSISATVTQCPMTTNPFREMTVY
jgi:hypothetical protein